MVYPHQWSPVGSSAGQQKFACQRPTFYHCATQPTEWHRKHENISPDVHFLPCGRKMWRIQKLESVTGARQHNHTVCASCMVWNVMQSLRTQWSAICSDWHSTGSTRPDCNWITKFRSQRIKNMEPSATSTTVTEPVGDRLQAGTEDAPVPNHPALLRRLHDSDDGSKYPDLLT